MGRKGIPGRGKPEGKLRPKRKGLPRGKKGSGWALLGLAASLATAWAVAAFSLGKRKRQNTANDRVLLTRMLLNPLMVTDHAACRMDCRHISLPEVKQLLQEGSLNEKKSDAKLLPCPKYVVDGTTERGQKRVQAVFSACRDTTKLVTVIDKDTDWECYCP